MTSMYYGFQNGTGFSLFVLNNALHDAMKVNVYMERLGNYWQDLSSHYESCQFTNKLITCTLTVSVFKIDLFISLLP